MRTITGSVSGMDMDNTIRNYPDKEHGLETSFSGPILISTESNYA